MSGFHICGSIFTATQEKIYLLAFREWKYMDILNFEEVNL
jgi:hypothetical protein